MVEDASLYHQLKKLIDPRHGELIFDGDRVQLPQVDGHPEGSVLLLDGHNGKLPLAVRLLDNVFLQQFIHVLRHSAGVVCRNTPTADRDRSVITGVDPVLDHVSQSDALHQVGELL